MSLPLLKMNSYPSNHRHRREDRPVASEPFKPDWEALTRNPLPEASSPPAEPQRSSAVDWQQVTGNPNDDLVARTQAGYDSAEPNIVHQQRNETSNGLPRGCVLILVFLFIKLIVLALRSSMP
jgi:hypothetical protein